MVAHGLATGNRSEVNAGVNGLKDDGPSIVSVIVVIAAKKIGAPGGGPAAVESARGRTFIVPAEKAEFVDAYRQAAANGTLIRTDPKTVRSSGFRNALAKEKGPAPTAGYDADHIVELCVGGANCAKTNGQWLQSGPNRAAGSKIGNQVKNDPLGTIYTNIKIQGD